MKLSGATGGAVLGTSTATITLQSEDIPPDTTPDAFSFTDQTGLPPNAEVQSNEITVAGINGPAPISIAGGEYSINGGAFTADGRHGVERGAGALRVTASISYSTTVSATLTIGGVSDTFSVTTKPATVVTVVRGKSGGGSFGWFGALLLGVLGVARRRRPGAVALGVVLSIRRAREPAARADDSGVYFGAGGGVSQVTSAPGDS